MFWKTVLFTFLLCIIWRISEQMVRKRRDFLQKYNGCGKGFQCFGISDNCLQTKDCTVLLKTRTLDSGLVFFNLFWERPLDSRDTYVAGAISADNLMGDDLSTIFTIESDLNVTTEKGLTYHNPSARKAGVVTFNGRELNGINILYAKYADGLLNGQWTLNQNITIGGLNFDTKRHKYYIMLAFGPVLNGIKQHHKQRWVSESAVYLNQNQYINE